MQQLQVKNPIQTCNYVKKIIFILFLFTVLFFPAKAAAHILATDKTIGAVLHINPNDDPIAHTPTSFFFEFKDKTNKFSPQNCDCTFIILRDNKQIYSQPLFQSNIPTAEYTFMQKDIYQLQIIGKPLSQNAFEPFQLRWDIRVNQDAGTQSTGTNNNISLLSSFSPLIIIGIVLLIFSVLYVYHLFAKKKQT